MGRRPCCSKEGLNRGAWTALEDKLLKSYIVTHGDGNWRNLPNKAGLRRCGKSCRLRWLNYLSPDIKRGNISEDEEELIIRLHNLLGNRWSLIAGRLPGRTDNEIKNYWNTALAKKSKSKSNLLKSEPKSSPETSQQENYCSKVIRTKATRCSTKFFPVTTSDHDYDRISPLPLLVSDFESQLEGHDVFNGVLKDDERNDDFPANQDEDRQLGLLTLTFDDHDDWVPNTMDFSCLGDGVNGTMDFESLAFLLDSEEWPSSVIIS